MLYIVTYKGGKVLNMVLKMFLFCAGVFGSALSFSMDNNHQIQIHPPNEFNKDSQFGYSMAAHGKDQINQKLLVGAPLASFTDGNETQYRGALFNCQVASTQRKCDLVQTGSGDEILDEFKNIYSIVSNYQRLGATLDVVENSVLVCAPNWHYIYTKPSGGKFSAIPGKCFFNSDLDNKKFSAFSPPIKNRKTDYIHHFNDGVCQAGLGASIASNKEVVIGAPGCTSWKGDVFAGKPKASDFRRSEESGLNDASYFGYSVASGVFSGRQGIVAASPRAVLVKRNNIPNEVRGSSISILEKKSPTELKTLKKLDVYETLNSNFAYCGYSISVGDINRDGLDDIVVGCPLYGKDQGAIVVFYQTENNGVFEVTLEVTDEIRKGANTGERFGTAVAVIEDIDSDGYKEVAVGSPYAYDGSGKVYIYCTTDGELPLKPSQILTSHEQKSKGLGWSIVSVASSLAVSSIKSAEVFIYSKLPVLGMTLTGSLDQLDMSKPCQLEEYSVPCAEVQFCIFYEIRNTYPMSTTTDTERERNFTVDVVLDVQSGRSRLMFPDYTRKKQLFFIFKPGKECQTETVYQKRGSDEIVEYLISAEAAYVSKHSEDEKKVVLDERKGLHFRDMMRIKVDCDGKTTNTCRTDATLKMIEMGSYIYGSSDSLQVKITVEIAGDAAYYPKLLLRTFGDLQKSGNVTVVGAQEFCNEYEDVISCSMGGIKFPGSVIIYIFRLTPTSEFIENVENASPKFKIEAEFTTMSEIIDESKTKVVREVAIELDPKLDLSKFSDPETIDLVDYKAPSSPTEIESLGPKVTHTYEIDNKNVYAAYGVQLLVSWPLKHPTTGNYLLYIAETPVFAISDGEESSFCQAVEGGTFDELKLKQKLRPGVRTRDRGAAMSEEMMTPSHNSFAQFTFSCNLLQIPANGVAKLSVVAYAVSDSFIKVRNDLPFIESKAEASIDHLPFGEKYTKNLMATISTTVIYPPLEIAKEYWYWILLAVLIGLLIVVLIGFIIYKCLANKKKADPVDAVNGGAELEEMDPQSPETELEEDAERYHAEASVHTDV